MSVSGELERALRTHSVRGYPASAASPFGDVNLDSSSRARQDVFFRVRPVNPIPFDELAKVFRWDPQPKNIKEWGLSTKFPALQTPTTFLPPEIWEVLEAGGKASWKDVMEAWLQRGGCLDANRNVICYDVTADSISIPENKIETGMLVEFYDNKLGKTGWAGRVVDVEGNTPEDRVVYLEVFEPVPFMEAPEALAPWKIRPGFYSNLTWKLGYGTAEGWEKQGAPLPPGEWQQDPERKRVRPHYLLKEPIPLAEVEEFCRKFYPEEPHCLWQSMGMYILPIQAGVRTRHHQGGTFRPIPEEAARSGEYMVWRPEDYT